MRNHKSNAFNPNNRDYNVYLYNSIRIHGWDSFKKEIIEEFSENESQNYVDERERFWIKYFDSTNREKGYNREVGGIKGEKRRYLTFEEKVSMSKIFSVKEISDIQEMLFQGKPMKEIEKKYSPKLTNSLLCNINLGFNFKNEKYKYPIHDYIHDGHSNIFSSEEQKLIQEDLIKGEKTYKEIAQKWGIKNVSLISLINNGKIWKNDNLEYPLSTRNNSRLHNFRTWVRPMQNDLLNSNLSISEIAKKYNKCYDTVKKINDGMSYRNDNYVYPLIYNRKNKN